MPSDNFYDKWLEQEPKPAPRPRKAQQPGITSSDDVEEVTQRIEAAGILEPTPPSIRLLFLPAKSSSTAIYQALNENGEQGLMFGTEGDTLAPPSGRTLATSLTACARRFTTSLSLS